MGRRSNGCKIDNKWVVYFDKYTQKKYGAVRETSNGWEDISEQVSFPLGTRHGTVIQVSAEEIANLKKNKQDIISIKNAVYKLNYILHFLLISSSVTIFTLKDIRLCIDFEIDFEELANLINPIVDLHFQNATSTLS